MNEEEENTKIPNELMKTIEIDISQFRRELNQVQRRWSHNRATVIEVAWILRALEEISSSVLVQLKSVDLGYWDNPLKIRTLKISSSVLVQFKSVDRGLLGHSLEKY